VVDPFLNNHPSSCLFILHDNKKYDYNTAFFNIYLKMYMDKIEDNEQFKELHSEFNNGQNMIIICNNLPLEPASFGIDNILTDNG